jgi:metal-responsive CopG/Arc/MetJ family transcriptional regulator
MDIEQINNELNIKSKRKWVNRYGVLGITLTDDLYKEFREYCNSKTYTMSGVIKVLIRNYLNEIKQKKNND